MEGDGSNIDSNYLQFVVGLLDDSADNYGDYVGRERADSITEFLKRERADSITDFLKRERQDSITDFLPKQSDFLMRDRAFSWDLTMEEQLSSDKAKGIAGSTGSQKVESVPSSSGGNNSTTDKKRKLDIKTSAPANNKSQKNSVKSPPLPVKAGSKTAAAQAKSKPSYKIQPVEQTIKRAKLQQPMIPDNKCIPPKMMDQFNMDMSKMVPGAMLGQVLPHALPQHGGQPHTLTRYEPFSVHLLDHTGLMPALHPMDASCPRVGAYTKEERQAIIAKFRAKKMRRVWRKQIKYDCRKRLADTRPRVKGRFVSRKERESQAAAKEGSEGEDAGSGEGEYDDE
eukprot:CAMPEP_0114430710 /NCGR_PEP_ID=MMETSP0103-20121206/10189_1 /TAXON_ID=37642 ORGANISM="Paraphysomonas imperforata, Strain PA2" /NCGR_SAMPLE_ID=MMETSP0103 /ASSEMBLY_ACC=CAM_ASM_000201 /LENGTH=340 /DNA_ID=CAMNT_0001600181 /DNA_START=128 /DNA_END=1150 /DNA_ORIENTATION=-